MRFHCSWQDINLEDQCLTIKRSIRYDGTKHKNVIGTTRRKKVRIVDFGDTLTEILKAARREQLRVHSALFAGQCQIISLADSSQGQK